MESNEWMFNVYLKTDQGEFVFDGEPDWGDGTPIFFNSVADVCKHVKEYDGGKGEMLEMVVRRVRNPYSLSTVEGQGRFLRAMQTYFEHR